LPFPRVRAMKLTPEFAQLRRRVEDLLHHDHTAGSGSSGAGTHGDDAAPLTERSMGAA